MSKKKHTYARALRKKKAALRARTAQTPKEEAPEAAESEAAAPAPAKKARAAKKATPKAE